MSNQPDRAGNWPRPLYDGARQGAVAGWLAGFLAGCLLARFGTPRRRGDDALLLMLVSAATLAMAGAVGGTVFALVARWKRRRNARGDGAS